MERTLFLIKPDALQRGLAGEIISRMERRGLKIVGMKLMQLDDALARRHYAEHEGKPFLESLISFITSGPLIAAALEGPNAIELVRKQMGATDPQNADSGTIRGDLALFVQYNLIHGSDSPESAERELGLFFGDGELVSWERNIDPWVFE
ncbi:MAG: nucleoside-diphosphate kinase [Chloroflexi bacterium]|nr:nucleoside-diphosphate kinase [Chloroflexota bacterium]